MLNKLDKSWHIKEKNICCSWFIEFLKCDGLEKSEYIKNYLEKKWYKEHKSAAWYNNYKSNENTYVGYWCFESAAIVKIFGVKDNSSWPYYPYDLVHT